MTESRSTRSRSVAAASTVSSLSSPLAAAVASLLVSACATSAKEDSQGPEAGGSSGTDPIVKCYGVNECKGHGQCAMPARNGNDANVCGGQNSCASKGWIELDQGACGEQQGEVLAVLKTDTTGCEKSSENGRLASDDAKEAYNLGRKGVALSGYDPVAYFPEGGGKPVEGSPEHALDHQGATYHFSSQANLEKFRASPEKYEPAYGGWCAYAMGKTGRKVSVDPEAFMIYEGQLLLFYRTVFANTRKKWQEEDEPSLKRRADAAWLDTSGECSAAP